MKKILLIVIPLLLTTPGARADLIAQAIWCANNSTLYFDYCETVTAGNTYSGQIVTKVYTVPTSTYGQYTELPWQADEVNKVYQSATTVVFTDAFKNFKPTRCLGWFKKFESLTTITGISNLDISEVTDMSYMFEKCSLLETLDVNTFNVSRVTDASGMFVDCEKLTTIYCTQTWNIETSMSMFDNCRVLKGALSYDSEKRGGEMANPINGYFTASLTLNDDASNTDYLTTHNHYYGNITLSGRTLYKDGSWNTLALPFDLTISGSVLDGATIKVFDPATWLSDEGVLTLKFQAPGDIIEAGMPFIIKWASGNEDIVNPTFNGVTIDESAKTVTNYDGNVNFVAKFSPFNITNENIHDILFVGANNKIGYSSGPRTLRACRAHFLVPAGTNAKAVNKVELYEDSETSAIIEVEADSHASRLSTWYTLDGVRLDSRPTTKGIYIQNGKKIVIR